MLKGDNSKLDHFYIQLEFLYLITIFKRFFLLEIQNYYFKFLYLNLLTSQDSIDG